MNMKKAVRKTVLLLTLMFSLTNAFAYEKSFSYNTDTSTFTVNYKSDKIESPFASLVVLPYGTDREGIENTDDTKSLFKICHTSGGKVKEEIELYDAFESGAYILYIESGEVTDKNIFIVPNENLTETVSAVNSGKSFSSSFGADETVFRKYSSDIVKLVRNAVPSGGYTAQSFLESYIASEGLVRFKNSELKLDEFIDLYDSYYGEIFSFSNEWDEKMSTEYKSILEKYDIGDMTAFEIAENSMFVTKCHIASDLYLLQKEVESYIQENSLSSGRYTSLNEYKKTEVFSLLYEEIDRLSSANEIYNRFIAIIEKVYSDGEKNNSSTSGGSSSGGGGGSFSRPVNVTVNTEENKNTEKNIFSDISGHWGREYITECYSKGLVNGFEDNTFRPDKNLTRAELTTLIVNLLKLENEKECVFGDVSESAWYYGSVAKAYTAGIVNGYGESFMPEANISRQDMAVIIYRSLKMKNISLSGEKQFDDLYSAAEYAQESICALASEGIINGDSNLFRPTQPLTRAEAATIIYRVSRILNGGSI